MRQLLDEIGDDSWVTEKPLDHLGPKVRAWLDAKGGQRWSDVNLVVRDLVLEIRPRWLGRGRMRDSDAGHRRPPGTSQRWCNVSAPPASTLVRERAHR